MYGRQHAHNVRQSVGRVVKCFVAGCASPGVSALLFPSNSFSKDYIPISLTLLKQIRRMDWRFVSSATIPTDFGRLSARVVS